MSDPEAIDADRLNDAMWAACNTPWIEDHVPTMERASEVAVRAVCAYLGVQYSDYIDSLDAEVAAITTLDSQPEEN